MNYTLVLLLKSAGCLHLVFSHESGKRRAEIHAVQTMPCPLAEVWPSERAASDGVKRQLTKNRMGKQKEGDEPA